MKLDSRVQIGERLEDHLSIEQRNILLDLRYLPWNGKKIKPGDRNVVQWDDRGKMPLTISTAWWVDDALARTYSLVKNHFERDNTKIKKVTFIQERKPPAYRGDEHDRNIANTNAGVWHNHSGNSTKNTAIVVLDEVGGTEFMEGDLEVADESKITHEEVSKAVTSGTAQFKTLKAGHVGRFTDKTVHKRGEFESTEPRLVIVVEFED